MGGIQTGFIYQGGTHEEMPLPGGSVMDRAAGGGAETGMFLSTFKVKIVLLEEVELVDGESKDPWDVFWHDELSRFVWLRNEGHV